MPLLFAYGEGYQSALLLANFNLFVLDYVGRQKASGGNLNFYVVKQLPILSELTYDQTCPASDGKQTMRDQILPYVLTEPTLPGTSSALRDRTAVGPARRSAGTKSVASFSAAN